MIEGLIDWRSAEELCLIYRRCKTHRPSARKRIRGGSEACARTEQTQVKRSTESSGALIAWFSHHQRWSRQARNSGTIHASSNSRPANPIILNKMRAVGSADSCKQSTYDTLLSLRTMSGSVDDLALCGAKITETVQTAWRSRSP